MTTGERLKRWREASGLSQEKAARVFGTTLAAYRTWETDRNEPTGKDMVYRRAVTDILEGFEEKHELTT